MAITKLIKVFLIYLVKNSQYPVKILVNKTVLQRSSQFACEERPQVLTKNVPVESLIYN